MKDELLNQLKGKTLEEICNYLPGTDNVRRFCGDIDGYFTTGYYDDIMIIGKQDLTLTFKIDKSWFEGSEELFESTPDYEEGVDFNDWNGEWKKTLDNFSSVLLLTHLLKIS